MGCQKSAISVWMVAPGDWIAIIKYFIPQNSIKLISNSAVFMVKLFKIICENENGIEWEIVNGEIKKAHTSHHYKTNGIIVKIS